MAKRGSQTFFCLEDQPLLYSFWIGSASGGNLRRNSLEPRVIIEG
jgi:hypothetical protein